MKIAPWDSYEGQVNALEKKMEREFQSLFQEMSDSGLLAEQAA
jgi:hypothetical protein